jgi:hypothetical protein
MPLVPQVTEIYIIHHFFLGGSFGGSVAGIRGETDCSFEKPPLVLFRTTCLVEGLAGAAGNTFIFLLLIRCTLPAAIIARFAY